ncbi:MAG: hypothetical protein ABIQ88_18990 [Chitinophagaceae bacterium]
MKKNISAIPATVLLLSVVLLFSSCLKDKCRNTYKLFTPVYKKLTALRAEVQSKAAMPVTNTGKLYIQGKWIFLNEQGKGIHVIDNSNPALPVKTSFINIPGNIDMSVKADILYADLYSDLAAINISDPRHITVAKYLTKTFPDKATYTNSMNPDSISILTDWISKDTIVDCDVANRWGNCASCGYLYSSTAASVAAPGKSATGMAGSMARFAAVNNYLYAVTSSNLNVIDISEAANPMFIQKKNIGSDIETIFPYNNKLYVGSGSSMRVYDLQDPVNPAQQSFNGHWCSGDPVVADDNYAYVTLHEANICGSKVNQLEIYSLSTPSNPVLVKTYPLSNPQGLSKDGNLMFICDGKEGLKIYDVSNVASIKLLKQFPGIETYDVIAANGIAYVVAKQGLYQFDYSSTQNIKLLSKLSK